MQKLRGELEAESQRLPEAHRLNASQIDRFMSNAKRSWLTQTGVGLDEFRSLCDRLDMTAKQVRFHMMGAVMDARTVLLPRPHRTRLSLSRRSSGTLGI